MCNSSSFDIEKYWAEIESTKRVCSIWAKTTFISIGISSLVFLGKFHNLEIVCYSITGFMICIAPFLLEYVNIKSIFWVGRQVKRFFGFIMIFIPFLASLIAIYEYVSK